MWVRKKGREGGVLLSTTGEKRKKKPIKT